MNNRSPDAGGVAAETSAARPPLSLARDAGRAALCHAFTLMELLIVIGIIVVLVGILLPTLGKARSQARVAQTQALMANLASDIDAYFLWFHAYPGPLTAASTTASTNKLSGSQNLMLGLSYALTNVNADNKVIFPLPTGAPVDPTFKNVNLGSITGPKDLASVKPDGSFEQLSPFFAPTTKQIFDFYPSNKFAMNTFKCPVPIDAFPDGLPILYYRRTVGVETAAKWKLSDGPAGYYFYENLEYTGIFPNGVNLIATSGVAIPQNTGGALFDALALTNAASNSVGTAIRGGYVLISAGIDRAYGTKNGKSDDLVQVGGE